MVSSPLGDLIGAIRRRWVLVAVTAVVATAVAVVGAVQGAPEYTATATITIEPTVFTRMPTLTGPERVIRAVQASEFYEQVAERLGDVGPAIVRRGLRSYTTGTPPQALVLTFTGSDQATAKRVAEVAAELAYEQAVEFNTVERDRQETIASSARAALEALDAEAGSTGWERSDIAVKRATMEQSLAGATYALELIDRAYTLEDGVSVAAANEVRALIEVALGALVLGALVGTGLALVSDRVSRKDG